MNIIQEELDIQSEYMFISVMVMVHLPHEYNVHSPTSAWESSANKNEVLST